MADVFISYSKVDRELAEMVDMALQARGYSTWWDRDLTPRTSWPREIERELAAASAVFVIWTANSVSSDWVCNEARRALKTKKLVPGLLGTCEIPLEFDHIQYTNLIGWRGQDSNDGWRTTVAWIAQVKSGCVSASLPAVATLRERYPLRTFEGHRSTVGTISFAPDGLTAISGSHDTTIKLWDVATGNELCSFAGGANAIYSVAIAPDGRTALSGGEKTLKLWDLSTGKEIRALNGHPDYVTYFSVAFSPDGRTALSGCADGTTKLWDVATGEQLRTFRHASFIKRALSATPFGGAGEAHVHSVAFAPDGRTALSGGYDKIVKHWEVETGKLLRTFIGHTDRVNAVAFAPDGRTAISGSTDKTLKLWSLGIAKEPRTFAVENNRGVNSVAFSPDGRAVLSGASGRLVLWDVATGWELFNFTAEHGYGGYHYIDAHSVAFAPDGRTAVSGGHHDDPRLMLWDVTR